ncbi:hypothetical protein ACFL4C_01405, partial [Candidatus Omnitrophota bacterium]
MAKNEKKKPPVNIEAFKYKDRRANIPTEELRDFVVKDEASPTLNPQTSDSSVYSYGSSHPLLEGRYQKGAWELNRLQVEGYDMGSDEPIIVDALSWSQIAKGYDRLRQVE